MGKLSELVRRDYEEEIKIIREAGGRLWPKWVALAIGIAVVWGIGLLLGSSWSKSDIAFGVLFVIAVPYFEQLWERYKVGARMRHEREIRMEVKLNALLGLVNITED
ncbi:MAG: hypothetical protein WA374_01655 [Acidobacteriaceae bacterium]